MTGHLGETATTTSQSKRHIPPSPYSIHLPSSSSTTTHRPPLHNHSPSTHIHRHIAQIPHKPPPPAWAQQPSEHGINNTPSTHGPHPVPLCPPSWSRLVPSFPTVLFALGSHCHIFLITPSTPTTPTQGSPSFPSWRISWTTMRCASAVGPPVSHQSQHLTLGPVRPRPWHPEKELPFLAQHVNTPFFLGGGNFAAAPRKPAPNGALREIVGESYPEGAQRLEQRLTSSRHRQPPDRL